ncbi:MAG TPA: ATP-binding cassette domain-containing protein [Bacillota bacterium]|nr:ATP-binding cassette domain-containing protein [Bacillota bacterium]HQC49436.1 ATP-binding cassette domain-containing protein [Bacillota bacterium]
MTLITLQNIHQSFGDQVVLKDFSLDIKEKEMLAITGPSGSGKSTILNIIGLLLKPTKGERTHFGKKNVRINSGKAISLLRTEIGYLFQNFALIDNESVMRNMLIAARYAERSGKKERIREALEEVGLSGKEKQKVFTLSGGEQQRLAMARLMVKPCRVILADEPTGNLDHDNQDRIMDLLTKLSETGKSIVMVTHERRLLDRFDRVVTLDS